MAWSVNDLAQITHLLTSELSDAIKASPRYVQHHFAFEVSGLMPAVSRTEGNNVLSLYLLHVGRDPYWRNTPVQGNQGQLNISQPLSLNLSYLLTSYAEKNWHMEQYLMSVALAYFHAHPIYTTKTAQFTITVEADSIEEMSRLWQAITVPIRLSAMFRVSVIFLAPDQPPAEDTRAPVAVSLSVAGDLNAAVAAPPAEPILFEMVMQVAYRLVPNPVGPPQMKAVPGQPVVAAGGTVRVRGSGLDGVDGAAVYLSPASGGGVEWPVPAKWRAVGDTASGTAAGADELVVQLGTGYAAAPASKTVLAATPLPGKYLIAVGNAVGAFRSNALPVVIAPEVTGIGGDSVLLAPVANVYTFAATGLVAGQTAVLLDTTDLPVQAAVGQGVSTVTINPDTTGTITFEVPAAGFVSGSYAQVRLVVNGIEALPGWWVLVP